MLTARGRAALWRPLRGAGGSGGGNTGGTFSGPYPNAIAGISGWWDAGTFDGLLDGSARPLPAWNNPAASVADKSGNGNALTAYRLIGSTLPPGDAAPERSARRCRPQRRGAAGDAARRLLPAADRHRPRFPSRNGEFRGGQQLDLVSCLVTAELAAGPGRADHIAQHRGRDRPPGRWCARRRRPPDAVLRQRCGDTDIRARDRRHTHSIIIRNTPGIGVDVWLDGVQVASGVVNPLGERAAEHCSSFMRVAVRAGRNAGSTRQRAGSAHCHRQISRRCSHVRRVGSAACARG